MNSSFEIVGAPQSVAHAHEHRSLWPLRIATLLLVLGTARYVTRDDFHEDESIVQPIIEITSVLLGACVALACVIRYRVKVAFRPPYLLLLTVLTLAVVFSIRSWNPLLSFARGGLLILISLSAGVLLQTYGLRPLLRQLLNAYIALIVFGVLMSFIFPEEFPLMVVDSGEEAVRARLHLFKIHPIALADDFALCLITSVMLSGRWVRVCRFVLLACLLLTVGRASIILGLPIYVAAEVVSRRDLSAAVRRLGLMAVVSVGIVLAVISGSILISGLLGPSEVASAIGRIVDATRDNQTLSGRTTLWTTLVGDLSLENFLGYGVSGARYYLKTLTPSLRHSHNSALETIYMSGYPGLGIALAAVAAALAACLRQWRSLSARVLTVACLYVLAAGMMNPSWYDTGSLMALSILCSYSWTGAVRPSLLSPVLCRSSHAAAG